MPERTPDYQRGQVIPGTVYRVHRVLGAGGMGTVYDVEDTNVGRRYVLKTLHGNLSERADLAARLTREARALAKLQHPNIVEVYTSGTTQDHLHLPFYVMERLQGQSLRTVLDRKAQLTLEQAYDIEIDLLDALDHAHESGIIHRDVKPDNIFITRGRDGRSLAKLLDFGIIKLAQQTNGTIQTGTHFIGTFRYAPPEQILGREITPRADLYAAALVLYEMLAGRSPFEEFRNDIDIGKAQVDRQPPPLSTFARVPPALDRLVQSALAKDPQARPADAYTFGQALLQLRQELKGAASDVHDKATVAAVVTSLTGPEGPSSVLSDDQGSEFPQPVLQTPTVMTGGATNPPITPLMAGAPYPGTLMSPQQRPIGATQMMPAPQGFASTLPLNAQRPEDRLSQSGVQSAHAIPLAQPVRQSTDPLPIPLVAPAAPQTFDSHVVRAQKNAPTFDANGAVPVKSRAWGPILAGLAMLSLLTSIGVIIFLLKDHKDSASPNLSPPVGATVRPLPSTASPTTTPPIMTATTAASASVAQPVATVPTATIPTVTAPTSRSTQAVARPSAAAATDSPRPGTSRTPPPPTANFSPTATVHRVGSGLE